MVSLMVLSTCVPVATASTLCITVKTNKPSYQLLEEVHVYGNLTYDGLPVPGRLVTIRVVDPDNNTLLVETSRTDAEGAYNLTFRLPSVAKLGTYTVNATSSYVGETVTNSTTFEVIEKTLLGDGWGWMRTDAGETVYGRVELYKIADEHIELVITYDGNGYSALWDIIFRKEYKHGEKYLCHKRYGEPGFLIVGFHKHRWQFWYAVGKGVVAFGIPRLGKLRLMPT